VLRRHLLVGLAALGAALAASPPARAAPHFERCGAYGYSCARVAVPLDRTGAVPGTVSLMVKRIRSRIQPARGAVFVLAGGPGQSATEAFAGDGVGLLYPAYRSRDVIVFDQRGTGRSGALRCRELEQANLLSAEDAAGRCAAGLQSRRAFYTTEDSVEDMEAIRQELGIDRIALFGTSYGTKVALAYALRYPTHVERLVLDSVVEPGGPDPLYADTIAAVPRALRAVCRGACSSFTHDPVADLQELVGRMRRHGRLRGPLVDSRGRTRHTSLGRNDLLGILIAGDLDPALRAAFPGAVRAALRGDPAPLLRLSRRTFTVTGRPPPPRILSAALYAATTCEETPFPWARNTPPDPAVRRRDALLAVTARPDSDFLPFDRATVLDSDLITLCGRWPVASPPPPPATTPLPNVPVLLLEGEDDLRTPEENAKRVAARFPQAQLVVAPATGHSVLGSDPSPCARRAFDRFFRGGRVPSHCGKVRRAFFPQPPPPTRLSRVRRLSGVAGLRGRTLVAVRLTLRDVLEDAVTELVFDPRSRDIARGGGLRGGTYRIGQNGGVVLRGLRFIPGVRVTGRIRSFGERAQRGRVRVAGSGVPGGVLNIEADRVSGRLGGRGVRAKLNLLVASRPVATASAAASPLLR
jgi:pimeloyl-ACP methyl ester carboxylesterase